MAENPIQQQPQASPAQQLQQHMDAVSLAFPLPFRVAALIALGAFCWSAALQVLAEHGIPALALVRHAPRPSSTTNPLNNPNNNNHSHSHSHHHGTIASTLPAVRAGLRLSALLAAGPSALLLLYWLFVRGDESRAQSWSLFGNLALLFVLGTLSFPPAAARSGVRRALRTFLRIAAGGLATDPAVKFGDVLAADGLVSYSKVLGDAGILACMAFSGLSTSALPHRACGASLLAPALTSYPTLVRIAQCLTEYRRSRGARKAPLANALKYATNLPVVWLSAALGAKASSAKDAPALLAAWYAAVLLNSTYSFYWDVAMDWDLAVATDFPRLLALRPLRRGPGARGAFPAGLRRDLRLGSAARYYAVVAADFVLRFAWGLKFSPRLDRLAKLEGGLFVFEALEVLRRGMWVVLRVETEDVRETNAAEGVDVGGGGAARARGFSAGDARGEDVALRLLGEDEEGLQRRSEEHGDGLG